MIRETSNLADGANLNFLDSSYHDVIILLLTPVIIVGKGWKGRRKEYFCSSLSSFFPSNQKKREKIIDFSRSFGWIFSGKESVSKYSSHCITFIFREIELFPFLFGLFPRLIFQFCHFFFKIQFKSFRHLFSNNFFRLLEFHFIFTWIVQYQEWRERKRWGDFCPPESRRDFCEAAAGSNEGQVNTLLSEFLC